MIKPYYEGGGVTLYHGEALSVLSQLEPGSADALITDPPYSSGGAFRSDRAANPTAKYRGWSQNPDGSSRKPTADYSTFSGDNRDQRSWMMWCAQWCGAAMQALTVGGRVFIFTDWRQLPATTDVMQLGGMVWRGVVVWDKGVGRPAKGLFRNHLEYVVWGSAGPTETRTDEYPSALIRVPTVSKNERVHLTQKPVELLDQLMRIVPEDDGPATILDPFAGAGSTLVAAVESGRPAIGVELSEEFCEIAAQRIEAAEVRDPEGA